MPVRLRRILEEGALMGDRPGTDVRERAELELRESEARFRTLAESSPMAIFVNREDKVVLANPACAKLFLPDSRSLVRVKLPRDEE